jgi:hypothetical protein
MQTLEYLGFVKNQAGGMLVKFSHFRKMIRGPIAQFPGTSVRGDEQVNSIIAGLNIQFGGKRRAAPAVAPEPVYQAAVAPEPIAQTAEVAPGSSDTGPGNYVHRSADLKSQI